MSKHLPKYIQEMLSDGTLGLLSTSASTSVCDFEKKGKYLKEQFETIWVQCSKVGVEWKKSILIFADGRNEHNSKHMCHKLVT